MQDGTSTRGPVRGLANPFGVIRGGNLHAIEPLRRMSVHTRRETRVMGRAGEDDGNVFRYEGLAAGQQFGAVILCKDAADVALLSTLLAEPLLLGASKTTGYGRVQVEIGQSQPAWREVSSPATLIPANHAFAFTALSDLIITCGNGQPALNITTKALAQWLNVPNVTIEAGYRATGWVGGFNQKLGLPLPQTPVIRAGSVFILTAGADIAPAAIQTLEAQGVGQRRAEGFGRIAVNWPPLDTQITFASQGQGKTVSLTQSVPANLQTLDAAESAAMAKAVTRRLVQDTIEQHLTNYLDDLQFDVSGLKPSQPNRLRVKKRSVMAASGTNGNDDPLQSIRIWLDNLKTPALRQFESAEVNRVPLLEWLRARTPEQIWAELQLDTETWPKLGPDETNIASDTQLAVATTVRLIDSVLARLAKEAKGND